ncbi:MAG TPA: GNAT family N-acetyltransferase [Stellaceae bacterium]|jgi:GNAT superfamily N-acetyltransferase|nr:GNAT family N-acetyltransferase [Stellaceae bacterium]
MSGDPTIELTGERDPQLEPVLMGGLEDYNREVLGRVDRRALDVVVRDDAGRIIGGILGHSSLGLFFLDLFYLPPALRRGGLGGRLMAQAEDEARRRGCTAAFVMTVDFQAPAFYEKHGYRRFGEIPCPPDGATRIFLSKTLD